MDNIKLSFDAETLLYVGVKGMLSDPSDFMAGYLFAAKQIYRHELEEFLSKEL